MELRLADHPLVAAKLTRLRDTRTGSAEFRRLVEELVLLLAYEATREIRVEPCEIVTPVAPMTGLALTQPYPLVVPILRAGLGMLEGVARLLPSAEVGFVGMVRDETTWEPCTYAERLPKNLSGRQCFVLDPMLATGGSLGGTVQFLVDRGAEAITAICLLAAPEGLRHLDAVTRALGVPFTLVLAAVDDGLNDHGYIVPGLGDAGDRLYGLAE